MLGLTSAHTWPFAKRGHSKVWFVLQRDILKSWWELCTLVVKAFHRLLLVVFLFIFPLYFAFHQGSSSPLLPSPIIPLGDLIFSYEFNCYLCGYSISLFKYNLPWRTEEQCALTEFIIFLQKLFLLLFSFLSKQQLFVNPSAPTCLEAPLLYTHPFSSFRWKTCHLLTSFLSKSLFV